MRLKLRLKEYLRLFGIRGILLKAKERSNKPSKFSVSRNDIKHPFYLRLNTTDIQAFKEIILKDEYHLELHIAPNIIIDAGANIGLASIYFANKYPDAKIFSIEPEPSNFELLVQNTAPYGNIFPLNAALWNKNTPIQIIDPGLGHWGFQTQGLSEVDNCVLMQTVQGLTLENIMKEQGIDYIDILKIDIEGAEKDVFDGSSAWINKVGVLIIELHDRLKVGCSRSFYNATNVFEHEWYHRENIYLARTHYLRSVLPLF